MGLRDGPSCIGGNERPRASQGVLRFVNVARGFPASESAGNGSSLCASDIVFSVQTPEIGRPATPGNGVHIAFQAPDRETIRRFYQTALAHGGYDEGAPGIRENYNANYYGAFVRDLDGNKIEAVTYTARESF